MSFLGLDVGTSGCKAVVFDVSGHPLASASREYAVISSQPHWAEVDSRQVGDSCLEVIAEASIEAARVRPGERVNGGSPFPAQHAPVNRKPFALPRKTVECSASISLNMTTRKN